MSRRIKPKMERMEDRQLREGASTSGSGLMKLAALLACAAAFAAGCASSYEKSADREVEPLLREYQARVDGERAAETPEGVITPKAEGAEMAPALSAQADQVPEIIDLERALALAFSNSREFNNQRESLYLSALSFTSTRHNFEWRPSATVSGSITTGPNASNADGDATLSLAKRLLTGGQFTLSSRAEQSGTTAGIGTDSNSSSVSLSFTQQLLAGAGAAAREQLVQAQRSLLYDARDFELYRQQLALDTISRYYRLLRQRRFIETAEATVKQRTFLYDQSKELFDKGRVTVIDLFRAEQEKLRAENNLSDEQVSYSLELDRFKLALGLPMDSRVDVLDQTIEPEILNVDLDAAMKTALANRLDLHTAKGRLEDSTRRVAIARNGLLPELEFFASAGVSNRANEDLSEFSTSEDGAARAGLTLVLPVDKKSERNAYKSAAISLARQRRSYEETQDSVRLSVRGTVWNLRQAEVSLAIQKKSVELAAKRLEAAQLRFEKGELTNRDVIEAQTELQSAQNAYVQAQVDYLLAGVQLRKDIGTLRVDTSGHWH